MRCYLLLLISVITLLVMCKSGHADLILLTVQRSPLSWPKPWYGYLMASDNAARGLCLIFGLPFVIKVITYYWNNTYEINAIFNDI